MSTSPEYKYICFCSYLIRRFSSTSGFESSGNNVRSSCGCAGTDLKSGGCVMGICTFCVVSVVHMKCVCDVE